jgi:hypothetical protein
MIYQGLAAAFPFHSLLDFPSAVHPRKDSRHGPITDRGTSGARNRDWDPRVPLPCVSRAFHAQLVRAQLPSRDRQRANSVADMNLGSHAARSRLAARTKPGWCSTPLVRGPREVRQFIEPAARRAFCARLRISRAFSTKIKDLRQRLSPGATTMKIVNRCCGTGCEKQGALRRGAMLKIARILDE